jgi:hypothetical protein
LAQDAENVRIEGDPPLNGVAADVVDLAPLAAPLPGSMSLKIDRVTSRTLMCGLARPVLQTAAWHIAHARAGAVVADAVAALSVPVPAGRGADATRGFRHLRVPPVCALPGVVRLDAGRRG